MQERGESGGISYKSTHVRKTHNFCAGSQEHMLFREPSKEEKVSFISLSRSTSNENFLDMAVYLVTLERDVLCRVIDISRF